MYNSMRNILVEYQSPGNVFVCVHVYMVSTHMLALTNFLETPTISARLTPTINRSGLSWVKQGEQESMSPGKTDKVPSMCGEMK